jgi:hypothetical protein
METRKITIEQLHDIYLSELLEIDESETYSELDKMLLDSIPEEFLKRHNVIIPDCLKSPTQPTQNDDDDGWDDDDLEDFI